MSRSSHRSLSTLSEAAAALTARGSAASAEHPALAAARERLRELLRP
jgi:hypothetical protein